MKVKVHGYQIDLPMMQKMCSNKYVYGTKAFAKSHLKRVNAKRKKQGERPLRIYRCPVCNKFHFTSNHKR